MKPIIPDKWMMCDINNKRVYCSNLSLETEIDKNKKLNSNLKIKKGK